MLQNPVLSEEAQRVSDLIDRHQAIIVQSKLVLCGIVGLKVSSFQVLSAETFIDLFRWLCDLNAFQLEDYSEKVHVPVPVVERWLASSDAGQLRFTGLQGDNYKLYLEIAVGMALKNLKRQTIQGYINP